MTLRRRLGLRGRPAIALVGMAVLAVGIATVIADRGIGAELREYGDGHRAMAVAHASKLAAGVYARERSWSPETVIDLDRMSRTNGYALTVYDERGRRLRWTGGGESLEREQSAAAPVKVAGRVDGRVELTPLEGALTEADCARSCGPACASST